MRFIDTNTIIGKTINYETAIETPAQLCGELSRLRIEKAFVTHRMARFFDAPRGNAALVDEITPHKNLYPTFTLTPLINLEFGGRENLMRMMRESRAAGIRLYPREQNFSLLSWNSGEIYDIARELRQPVMIDACQTGSMEEFYSLIASAARENPDVVFIMQSTLYRQARMFYVLLDKYPNIRVDTSALHGFRSLEEIVANFGAKRILFGTRMPHVSGGVAVGRVLYADIPEKDKELIAHANAEALFGCLSE